MTKFSTMQTTLLICWTSATWITLMISTFSTRHVPENYLWICRKLLNYFRLSIGVLLILVRRRTIKFRLPMNGVGLFPSKSTSEAKLRKGGSVCFALTELVLSSDFSSLISPTKLSNFVSRELTDIALVTSHNFKNLLNSGKDFGSFSSTCLRISSCRPFIMRLISIFSSSFNSVAIVNALDM